MTSFRNLFSKCLVLVSVLGMAALPTVAGAKEKKTTEPVMEIKGKMPLLRLLLTGEWVDPAALQAVCAGAPDGDAVAKCVQAELDGAEGGKDFTNLFGTISPIPLNVKGNHAGAKKGGKVVAWIALGIITAGIAPGVACTSQSGCIATRQVTKFRLNVFHTSAAKFTAVEEDGIVHFNGRKGLDSKEYPILFITTN